MAEKKINLNEKKRTSLQQTSILFFSGIAMIIILALFTYHPTDSGVFHYDSSASVQNKAGPVGAYLADILMGILGYLAYLVPLGFLALGFSLFRKSSKGKGGGINTWLTVWGGILALLSLCGLVTLLWPDSHLVYKSGGFIGVIVAKIFVFFLGDFGAALALFSSLVAGITLIGDISWLKIIDNVGEKVLDSFEWLMALGGSAKSSPDVKVDGKQSPSILTKVTALTAGLAGSAVLLKDTLKKKVSGATDIPVVDKVVSKGSEKETVLGLPDDLLTVDADTPPQKSADATITKEAKPQYDSSKSPNSKSKRVVPRKDKLAPSIALGTLLPLSLLNEAPKEQGQFSEDEINDIAGKIITSLQDYGVHGVSIENAYPGPVITRFELQLAAGTKVSKITGLAKDLARNMGVMSIRIVDVIPGKTTIGIEVPNSQRDLVTIRDVLASDVFKKAESPLSVVLGKTIGGKPAVVDLTKMPHLLIAGTTGSGKSVGLNAMLISLLYKSKPENVRLILIDPKMLELSIYEGIPHLLTSVVTDMNDAADVLRWCVGEMERRYTLMSYVKVRSISGYNDKVSQALKEGKPITDSSDDTTVDAKPKILEPLPYIVVVIDEFADMIMVIGKKVEELIARLAQKARAAGIHLVLATERPSVDVITGLIKANIPSRIAFQVSTKVDSRTILDQSGAEQLLGNGDMLYLPSGTGLPQRVHGAFVDTQEVEDVVQYLKDQEREPEYLDDVLKDTGGASGAIPGLESLADSEGDVLYDQAVAIVTESRRASVSYLQRRLKIGYNRAANMIESMEAAGVVSAVQPKGGRKVLTPEPVTD